MAAVIPIVQRIRACTLCAAHLPLGPRPVLQFDPRARILIAAQAPGRRVHETGIPFDDLSGERLRAWLGLSRDDFYDARRVAIVPMGFCYPGQAASGDNPPRPECARTWHPHLLPLLHALQLTVIIGRHALAYHQRRRWRSVTDAVAAWPTLLPERVVLPHPSGRNNPWLAAHPWFESELLPPLRARVAQVLAEPAAASDEGAAPARLLPVQAPSRSGMRRPPSASRGRPTGP